MFCVCASLYNKKIYSKRLIICYQALELLTPCVEINSLSRARCHARRGMALCRLGIMQQGIGELKAAVALQPNDDKLRMDLEKVCALVETSVEADELE
jgi:dyslexia susceptibility 1 candidate gene 1 protein